MWVSRIEKKVLTEDMSSNSPVKLTGVEPSSQDLKYYFLIVQFMGDNFEKEVEESVSLNRKKCNNNYNSIK